MSKIKEEIKETGKNKYSDLIRVTCPAKHCGHSFVVSRNMQKSTTCPSCGTTVKT